VRAACQLDDASEEVLARAVPGPARPVGARHRSLLKRGAHHGRPGRHATASTATDLLEAASYRVLDVEPAASAA
jgi:hypothetical protein